MPCRLAVFLSRRAPVGVILRRGPSAWAQLIHWDRTSDRFTPGQWFRGRVYERRCDLSPDGRLFVYFAAKYGAARRGSRHGVDGVDGVGETWTAISRPPYFTALALWSNLGAWYGGGVFRGDGTVLIDSACGQVHPKLRPHPLRVEHVPPATAPWEQRLLRDGWRLVERGFDARTHRRVGEREVWEKSHPGSAWKLCRQIEDVDFQRYGGPYSDTYWLETSGDLIPLSGVTWADWDRWDRLVFVREGKLFWASAATAGVRAREIFDPNPLQPQEVPTPDWATRW